MTNFISNITFFVTFTDFNFNESIEIPVNPNFILNSKEENINRPLFFWEIYIKDDCPRIKHIYEQQQKNKIQKQTKKVYEELIIENRIHLEWVDIFLGLPFWAYCTYFIVLDLIKAWSDSGGPTPPNSL